MKNIIIAGILAGIVVFIWGSLSWMVLPFHKNEVKTLPEEAINLEVMSSLMTENAIYHYPGFPTPQELEADKEGAMAAIMEKYKRGPIVNYMAFSPDGMDVMNPMQYVYYLLMNIIAGIIAAYIIFVSEAKLNSFWKRVLAVVLLAVFASLIGPIANWNWWKIPTYTTMTTILDFVVAWGLAGMVISWRFNKPLEA